MAKNRKSNKPATVAELAQRAERALAKGDAKAALKDAVVCFRKESTAGHRQLLERCYAARIEQLHRKKQTAEAKAVLDRLLELKPADAGVLEKLPKLKLIAGVADANAAAVMEQDPAFVIKLADDAVLDSRTHVPATVSWATQVAQVREALQAVEQADDLRAAELVKDIPRNSPLCDWKLFVRGLSAFYQRDRERMQANWQRLDAHRPAFRIAQTLEVAGGELPAKDVSAAVVDAARRLEKRIQEDPAAERLRRLASAWREGTRREFITELKSFAAKFRNTHATLLDTVVDAVWKRAVGNEDRSLLNRLTRIVPAPALDPRWNRARALLAEYCDDYSCSDVEDHWRNYADEVAELPALREDERPIASGLVYLHLARQFVSFADDYERPGPFYPPDEEAAELVRGDADEFFREAIRRCPRLFGAYRELAKLCEFREQPERAAEVLRQLVVENADDYDAQLWLANYHLGRDEPEEAEPYVTAVSRLKPRDRACEALRWNHQITRLRCLALKRKFDAARQAWEEAARVAPPHLESYALDLLRAGVEFRAKDRETAEEFLRQALEKVDDPTPIWLRMSCTAARFKLHKDVKKDFDGRFKQAIEGKINSATAGGVARFLCSLKESQINYTGRATQERLFLAALRRARRVQWEANDLREVCLFLEMLPRQWELREQLVARGLKKFPNDPMFHFWTAEIEMESGPFRCNVAKATKHVRRALELLQSSASTQKQALGERMKKTLAMLEEAEQRMRRLSWFVDDEDDEDEDLIDEDDDDFDDVDHEDEFRPHQLSLSFADNEEDDEAAYSTSAQRSTSSFEDVKRQVLQQMLNQDDDRKEETEESSIVDPQSPIENQK